MKRVKRDVWITADGREFFDRGEAAEHEKHTELVQLLINADIGMLDAEKAANALVSLHRNRRIVLTVLPPSTTKLI